MNLFELQAVLSLNSSGYKQGLDDAEKEGNTFLGKVQGLTGKVANAWGTAKSAVQGIKTTMGPLISLVSDAVSAYGDYEQLIGGVNKLFGSASKTITTNAKKAFKEMGVSANDYMELCIMFGASMLRSVGEDSAKAADLMDMAIADMADNVNSLGTDMDSVKGAYRGFAREIYTGLDALGLGYGGSASGMYKLLTDAAKLNKEFAETAQFSLDASGHLSAGYADIVRAIHIIQQSRNITGTSAAEASTTQQGSKAAMEAAKENMLVILADSESSDTEKAEAAKAYADAMGKYLKNLIPVIKEVLKSLLKAIGEVIPDLVSELPAIIGLLVDIITDPSILKAIAYAIVSALAALADLLVTALVRLFNPQFAEGSSAFKEWGVYKWINKAFGYEDKESGVVEFEGYTDPQMAAFDEARKAYEALGGQAGYNRESGRYEVTTPSGTTSKYFTVQEATDFIHLMLSEAGETVGEAAGAAAAEESAKEFSYGDKTYTLPAGDTPTQWFNFLQGLEQLNGSPMNPQQVEALMQQFGGHLTEMQIPKTQMQVTDAQMTTDGAEITAANVTFANGLTLNFASPMTIGQSVAEGDYTSQYTGLDWYKTDNSQAKGLWSVPYDDYRARLHRDEMVLTASQAREYRNGGGGQDVVAAINGLRNDITHLQLVVGQKPFGAAVVDYSGRRMQGYIGQAEDRTISGYGWG